MYHLVFSLHITLYLCIPLPRYNLGVKSRCAHSLQPPQETETFAISSLHHHQLFLRFSSRLRRYAEKKVPKIGLTYTQYCTTSEHSEVLFLPLRVLPFNPHIYTWYTLYPYPYKKWSKVPVWLGDGRHVCSIDSYRGKGPGAAYPHM